MYLFSALLLYTFASFSKAAIPQRCEELSISANEYQNSLNTSVSLVIQVSEGNGKNVITVKNFTRIVQQSLRDLSHSVGKSVADTNVTVCISNQCFANFDHSVSALVDNGIFEINVQWNLFGDNYVYKLFNGIVDGKNLIFYDGSLFDSGKQCMEYNDFGYLPSLTTCCTSFKQIPAAPPPTTKCSNFKAVSSVFEMQNNNLIATNYADFVLTDNDVTAIWHYIEDDRFFHSFSINTAQCQTAPAGNKYCYYYIGNQNKELLIQDGFIEEFVGGPNVLIGRIILRDDQTLMEEGIPFSSSNQCQNYTGIVTLQIADVTFRVENQFCCTDFEPKTTTMVPTTVTGSTTPLPTKLMAQKCDKISSFSTEDYFANVTSTMQIKYQNNTNRISISDIKIVAAETFSDVSICVYDIFSAQLIACQDVASNSANFNVTNKMIKFVISYLVESGGLYLIDIFKGVIDQGNFVSWDGILFDQNDNRCFESSASLTNTTLCCVSNQNTPSATNYPKCTNFNVASTFYDTTTNDIYTSATADFSLMDTDLTANGYYIGEIPSIYSINYYSFQSGINKTQYVGHPVYSSNAEFFIQIQYYSTSKVYDPVFVGRIILLDGQTFFEQGIPLTASKNCLNVTSPYHDIDGQEGIVVINELCCTAFAGIPIATTTVSTSSSMSPSTSISTAKPVKTTQKPLATSSASSSSSSSTTSSVTSPLPTDPSNNTALMPSFNIAFFFVVLNLNVFIKLFYFCT